MGRGRPTQWDWNALHRFMWEHVDRRGIFSLKQDDLAQMFGVGKAFVSQVMDKFEQEQRITRISKPYAPSKFLISDPDFWTEPPD